MCWPFVGPCISISRVLTIKAAGSGSNPCLIHLDWNKKIHFFKLHFFQFVSLHFAFCQMFFDVLFLTPEYILNLPYCFQVNKKFCFLTNYVFIKYLTELLIQMMNFYSNDTLPYWSMYNLQVIIRKRFYNGEILDRLNINITIISFLRY